MPRAFEVARIVGADPNDPDLAYLFSRATKSHAVPDMTAPASVTSQSHTPTMPVTLPASVTPTGTVGEPSRPARTKPVGEPSRSVGKPNRSVGEPSRSVGEPSRPARTKSARMLIPYDGTIGTQAHVAISAAELPQLVVEVYLHRIECMARMVDHASTPMRKYTAKEIRLGREALAHRDQVGRYQNG